MGNMLVDHFVKPLQGLLFREFHEEIQGIPNYMGQLDMFWLVTGEPVIPIPQECVGCNGKYTGTILCNNGSNVWYMIPFSNKSNRWVLLSIQFGTGGECDNIPKNIYCQNSLQNIDCVDDCVCDNGCVRYDSPMTSNQKTRVSYANVV